MREFCRTVTTSRRALTLHPVQALEMELELGQGGGIGPGEGGGLDRAVVAIWAAATVNDGGGGPGGGGGGDYSEIFTGKEVTSRARLISKPEPQYTEEARKSDHWNCGTESRCLSSGQVYKHSHRFRPVRDWPNVPRACHGSMIKFVPASKDGHQVSMRMQLEYNFNLY